MIVTPAAAQTRASILPFAARLEQARSTLEVDADGMHGAGTRAIAEAVTKARYVVLGEDHLSREFPKFATAMYRTMVPGGLRAFAVETGPEATRIANANLRRPDRIEWLAAFMKAHPDAMAFQNGRDESDMAAPCATLAGPQFEIWSLDQEFFGASGFLFEQMLAAPLRRTARAAIEALIVRDRATNAAALASGSPGDLLLYRITDREMAEAPATVRRDGNRRIDGLFDSFAETRSIFCSQNSDGYASNGQRTRLLKRTLITDLAGDRSTGRILFKFGDVHAVKGMNGLGQRDLGNVIAGREEGEGVASLHLAVFGAKGTHALYGGVGRPLRLEPFTLTDDTDYAWLKDGLTLRDKAGDDKQWMLVDLRAMQARPSADMPPAWRKKSYEFDMLIVAPELTPSSLIGMK